MDDLLTPAEKAQSRYNARLVALGLTDNDDMAQDAWANAFAVEVHAQYADDAERWDVALATLDLLADAAGLEG